MANVQQKVLLPDGTEFISEPSDGNGTLKLRTLRTGAKFSTVVVANAAQRMGMRIVVNGDTVIIHHGGADTHSNRVAVIRSFREQITTAMQLPLERRKAEEQLLREVARRDRAKLLDPWYEPRPDVFARS